MKQVFRATIAVAVLATSISTATPASAEKPGGVLRIPMITSPASMSIHEAVGIFG